MARTIARSWYFDALEREGYGCVPLPETFSFVVVPEQPPVGGVGGSHGVDQLKETGFPFGSSTSMDSAPSPESNRLTRMVLPACTGATSARYHAAVEPSKFAKIDMSSTPLTCGQFSEYDGPAESDARREGKECVGTGRDGW